MIPLGHKHNTEIKPVGVDTVTGLPATTAGSNASGNPVVSPDHPAAVKAINKNKTHEQVRAYFEHLEEVTEEAKDKIKEKIAVIQEEAQGSGNERYEAGDWTKTEGAGLTDNVAKAEPVIPVDNAQKLTDSQGNPITTLKTPV